MNSRLPIGFPAQSNSSRGGPRRGSGLPLGTILIAGAILAVLILLFVLGSTGITEEAEADGSRVDDLTAIVGPALTRAGYGDVVVTSDGRTVTLTGELPTRTDVVAAHAVASSIAEVAFVQNNLSHPGDSADIPIPGENTPSAFSDNPVVSPSAISTVELELQLRLATIVATSPIAFEQRSFELTADSQATLQQVIAILSENVDVRVQVGGHTDSSGDPAANEVLAEERANAVMAAMIAQGIDEQRLVAVGFGDSQPIASNELPDGRAQNRRIEFLIIP